MTFPLLGGATGWVGHECLRSRTRPAYGNPPERRETGTLLNIRIKFPILRIMGNSRSRRQSGWSKLFEPPDSA